MLALAALKLIAQLLITVGVTVLVTATLSLIAMLAIVLLVPENKANAAIQPLFVTSTRTGRVDPKHI
eukprot:6131443-Pleurochrysis_carterae.AAC.1